MKPYLIKFQTLFNQHAIYMQYKEVVKDFKCYLVTETINNINEVEKLQNKSKIVIIDQNCELDGQYFFICLDNAIIIVSRKLLQKISIISIKHQQFLTEQLKNIHMKKMFILLDF